MAGFLASLPTLNDMFGDTQYSLESGISYDPVDDMPEWYWVKVHNANSAMINKMRQYCYTTFGKDDSENWMINRQCQQFLFTHERDQTLFLLRWAK